MLGIDGGDPAFLATPVVDAAPGAAAEPPLPEAIGEFRVLRVLGRGGMGVVYEAQQRNPERRVAPKVVLPGHATDEVLHRFAIEARLLARLQHPGIAQILCRWKVRRRLRAAAVLRHGAGRRHAAD